LKLFFFFFFGLNISKYLKGDEMMFHSLCIFFKLKFFQILKGREENMSDFYFFSNFVILKIWKKKFLKNQQILVEFTIKF